MVTLKDPKVVQILNNNVVSAVAGDGMEVILTGKGLGFAVRAGSEVDLNRVEKVFCLQAGDAVSERLKTLIESLPLNIVQMTSDIIERAKETLSTDFNDSLFIALADHLDCAAKRAEQGIEIKNPLDWEVKNYYKREYQFACEMIEHILVRYNTLLPKNEAYNVALHIINALDRQHISDVKEVTKIVFQIQNIVKYYFKIKVDEETTNYQRFITHLKFFAQRVHNKEVINNHDSEFVDIIHKKHTKTFACVEVIAEFMAKNYGHKMSDSEKLYLVIHIGNVVGENEFARGL